MNLYIQIKDGKPYQHPVAEYNLQQIYPSASYDNIPEGFAKFVRIEKPRPGVDEVVVGPKYEWCEEGVCFKDVWIVRPMTENEKLARIRKVWIDDGGHESWIANPETYEMEAPIVKPDDGQEYEWNEEAYQADEADPKTAGWELVVADEP